jgi:hypothetical protein
MTDKFNTGKINLDVLLVEMACGPFAFQSYVFGPRIG